MKYDLPHNQAEILPNILNLTSSEDIALAEFDGFLKAEIMLSEKLTSRTKFNVKYIVQLHRLSLGASI
jgi:cell filamentation protein